MEPLGVISDYNPTNFYYSDPTNNEEKRHKLLMEDLTRTKSIQSTKIIFFKFNFEIIFVFLLKKGIGSFILEQEGINW